MNRVSRAVTGLTLLALSACSDNGDRAAPSAPLFAVTTTQTLSGNILGPAGSICNSIPAGTRIIVIAFHPADNQIRASVSKFCPDNSYALTLESGTYLVRVAVPADPTIIGSFPWRTITGPVVLGASDLTLDVTLGPGTALGGHVTFNGQPVAGQSLTLVYDQAHMFAAAFGTSDATGAWMDDFGRTPLLLQSGVRYHTFDACLEGAPFYYGVQLSGSPPPESFDFPAGLSSLDCPLQTASAVAFSHERTPLVVTPMPGDFGGLSDELFAQFGRGWGVQLVGAGQTPQHNGSQAKFGPPASALFVGGLFVGIRPGHLMSGIGLHGIDDCVPTCRDLGLNGQMQVTSLPHGGNRVTWRYSDAPSANSVGLKVVQRSVDGPRSSSYVLFRFTFTNTARTPVTFYVGSYMDWDVGSDPNNNVGFSDRGGQLMYESDAAGAGPFFGTLIGGAPVSGNWFANGPETAATYVAAMAGDTPNPDAPTPGDQRYIHAVGPITLNRHESADVWIVLVGGENSTDFFANVDAAEAAVNRRAGGPDPFANLFAPTDANQSVSGTVIAIDPAKWRVGSVSRNTGKSLNGPCKLGCRPK